MCILSWSSEKEGLVTRYPAFPPKSSFNWVNRNKMQSVLASTRNINVQIPCKIQGLFHHSLSSKKHRFLSFIMVFFRVNKAWNLKHFCTHAKNKTKKAENIISSSYKTLTYSLLEKNENTIDLFLGFRKKTNKLLTAKFYKMGASLIKFLNVQYSIK